MHKLRILPVALLASAALTVSTAHAEPAPTFTPLDLDGLSTDAIAVDVKDGLGDADIAALGREYGIDLHDNSPAIKDDANIAVAHVGRGRAAELLARLRKDPRVEVAEPLGEMQATFTPNDPKFGDQWHMSRVGAERAWEVSCGSGVTVAVIDTGVACYDEAGFTKGTDLAGTRCVPGYNYVEKNERAADDHGHGTHVAGTIAQTTNNGLGVAGLAYCARIMPVKVLSAGGFGTTADVAEGIRFAADHGAQVLNLSLGGPIKSKILEDAVNHARAKGALVVAAAGNSGKSVGYPAAYPGVLAVSATDRNDKIAWFSSRGSEVGIGAPGVAVTQQTVCNKGKDKCEVLGVFNGTSMASPHVAGAAAMVVATGVTDPDAVRSTLERTAVPKDDPKLFGAGILDAAKATMSATFLQHLLPRLMVVAVLLGLLSRRLKKTGGALVTSPGAWLGILVGGFGLFPVAGLLGLLSRLGPMRPVAEALLTHPLGEWDMAVDVGLHKYMALANALPVLAAFGLFFGVKSLRPTIGGFALGTAAFLTQVAISGDQFFFLGNVPLRIFAVANAAICVWLARVALDEKA
ncbi:MAG: S8 family peptidase [Polyangiaceae bacterium]|jgi:serine protease